jgi:hypothetical protein
MPLWLCPQTNLRVAAKAKAASQYRIVGRVLWIDARIIVNVVGVQSRIIGTRWQSIGGVGACALLWSCTTHTRNVAQDVHATASSKYRGINISWLCHFLDCLGKWQGLPCPEFVEQQHLWHRQRHEQQLVRTKRHCRQNDFLLCFPDFNKPHTYAPISFTTG